MKAKLCVLLAAFLGIFCPSLLAGNLKVNLTPTQAVSAGAQWRVDSGTWRSSGTTASGLSNGTHQVSFSAVSGWIAPATTNVTVTSGTTTVSYAYVQASSLKITLTPSTGKWRLDGGAWQNSAATVANLAPGAHTVDYQALAGYAAPNSESVTLTAGQLTSLNRSYTQLASLTVTLTPASAQWRVDGGAWRNSGTTATNLSVGSHTIDYAAASGYITPGSESVTLTAGQSLPLSRTYVALPQLTLNLTPASAQWQVDGGAWQSSGSTVTGLSVGSHSIAYSAVSGYITPSAESVSLAAGQQLALGRSYVQLAQLTVLLSNTGGQFRVDGGAWLPSGATVANLLPGAHSVAYAPLNQFAGPPDESVTLAAGQSLSLTRVYIQLAAIAITLNPTSGQWRVDGGAWQASGSTLFVLPGNHTIDYAGLALFDAPASESISLAEGGSFTTTRSYVSQKPTLRFNLTPAAGEWRVDGGAWRASGSIVSELDVGSHTVDFVDIGGDYEALASETVSLALHEHAVFARTYPFKKATVKVTLDPSTARWRIDAGAWRNSDTTAIDLPAGSYTIDYETVDRYLAPPPESISLTYGQNLALSRSYTPLASIGAITNVAAQFRVDGGDWQATNSAHVYNLAFNVPHTVDFSAVEGYVTPTSQTVTLAPGEDYIVGASYTPLASIGVITNVAAQFRVDGGAWQAANSAHVYNLAFNVPHTVDFSAVDGYATPPSQTVTLAPGEDHIVGATYLQLASVTVQLVPNGLGAHWRIDGGDWRNGAGSAYNLTLGVPHTVEYEPVADYVTPASQTMTLAAGESRYLIGYYQKFATLTVNLTPTFAQWRLDGGTWNASGATVDHLSTSDHVVEYSVVSGYIAPATETVSLATGSLAFSRTYTEDPPFAIVHAFDDAGNLPTAIRGSDGWVYVATSCGITNGLGLLYRMQPDGSQRQLLMRFSTGTVTGAQPKALIEGSDGILYGTTLYGDGSTSAVSNGTIYKVNRDGTGYTLLYTVSGTNWGQPNTLIEGADGALYGTTTSASGSGNNGKIFRLNKDGSGFTVLRSLSSSEGVNPQGICQLPSGQLYITNKTGGANNLGSIYAISPSGTNASVIKSFAGGADGSDLRARLTLASDGMLYGTTAAGGSSTRGLIFRLNSDGSGYQVLHQFVSATTDGLLAETPVIEQPDGMLYGTTAGGGAFSRGTVYRMNKDGSGFAVIKSLAGTVDEGSNPRFNLVPLGDGRLFGATISLGSTTRGVFFTLNLDGSGFTTVLQQGALDGAEPWSAVTEADGVLYGTAHAGGSTNNGTLYRVNRDGTAFTVLKHFNSTDGGIPVAAVLPASDGLLYGSTYSPSKIFRVARDGSGYTVIQDLPANANGSAPWGGMIEASDGFIYGTTMGGGTGSYGVIYRFAKPGTSYTVLHAFNNSVTDGGQPTAALCEGLDGRLYGTTTTGGSANLGTVFAVNKDGTGFTILHHFTGADGNGPYAALLQRVDGTLFGITNAGGGANLGVLYKLAPDGSGYAVIKSFAGGAADGSGPIFGPIVEKDGKLYGTTVTGGLFNAGTVYRINPDGSGFEILINFTPDVDDTGYPWAGLMKGSDGKLYGTGTRGPSSGAVFRLRVN